MVDVPAVLNGEQTVAFDRLAVWLGDLNRGLDHARELGEGLAELNEVIDTDHRFWLGCELLVGAAHWFGLVRVDGVGGLSAPPLNTT